MTEKQDMGVVTQSDREAAVDIYNVILHDWHTQHMLDGMEDECYVIQAFKKHRLASQADLLASEIANIAKEAALSQPPEASDAEPVAWKCQERTMGAWYTRYVDEQPTGERYRNIVPLYAHPPAAEPVGLREAVEGIDDDYMTSEKHHPGYVLIPTAKFEQIVSAAKRAKEIVPSYYVNWHHDADKALATPARTDDAGVGDAGADGEMEALRSSLRNLLDACFQADGAEELPEQIDGTLLDAASDALELQYPIIWTDEQVAMLETRQADASLHPYTCGGDRTDPAHRFHAEEAGEEAGLLYPTARGWKCPACDYRQFWSHETGGPSALSPAPDHGEVKGRISDMLDTAKELRENSNGNCGAIREAMMWEDKAAALQKGPSQ